MTGAAACWRCLSLRVDFLATKRTVLCVRPWHQADRRGQHICCAPASIHPPHEQSNKDINKSLCLFFHREITRRNYCQRRPVSYHCVDLYGILWVASDCSAPGTRCSRLGADSSVLTPQCSRLSAHASVPSHAALSSLRQIRRSPIRPARPVLRDPQHR